MTPTEYIKTVVEWFITQQKNEERRLAFVLSTHEVPIGAGKAHVVTYATGMLSRRSLLGVHSLFGSAKELRSDAVDDDALFKPSKPFHPDGAKELSIAINEATANVTIEHGGMKSVFSPLFQEGILLGFPSEEGDILKNLVNVRHYALSLRKEVFPVLY